MKRLILSESIFNLFDLGVYVEMAQHAKKKRFKMAPATFIKHLIFGKGYKNYTPPQLERVLKKKDPVLVIDLREKKSFARMHIPGAILHPFDDFIGNILMDNGYEGNKEQSIILVCDTGQKSKVAASILREEGFGKVFSLKRGMRRWRRWEKLKQGCQAKNSIGINLCGSIMD